MKELIKKLTDITSPSGNEDLIREAIREEIKEYCDDLKIDRLGNLIAFKHGGGAKIQFAAHMDEIGVIVTYIDDQGFLRFSNVGGLSPFQLLGQRVRFTDGTLGVFGLEKLEQMKDWTLNKMYIDIGATSKEEAEEKVAVGEFGGIIQDFADLGRRVAAKSMDNRVGCAVLIEALKRVQSPRNDLYCTFTVQEEVGLRGAKTSAFAIEPDLGIAVDVTLTGDTPEAEKMAVGLGKGVAIKVKDQSLIAHRRVKELLVRLAKEKKIPYQLEVLTRGGTDSGAIHLTRAGVPSGVISIPTRYVHSPSELIDLEDVEAAVQLVVAVMETPCDPENL
ncbi:MAG TPA: M42 family metallopeptidase [Firmicutes bacterium]|nr:M42 family metallopeptidase [Bacillota bacterium]